MTLTITGGFAQRSERVGELEGWGASGCLLFSFPSQFPQQGIKVFKGGLQITTHRYAEDR